MSMIPKGFVCNKE